MGTLDCPANGGQDARRCPTGKSDLPRAPANPGNGCSRTVYKKWGKGVKQLLWFSKYRHSRLEAAPGGPHEADIQN